MRVWVGGFVPRRERGGKATSYSEGGGSAQQLQLLRLYYLGRAQEGVHETQRQKGGNENEHLPVRRHIARLAISRLLSHNLDLLSRPQTQRVSE